MECETLKEFFEKHKEKIITLLLCGVLFIIVLSVLALISGAIMKVFGFEYRSIGSIILFFIILLCFYFFNSIYQYFKIRKAGNIIWN